jgi:hypothetical protein
LAGIARGVFASLIAPPIAIAAKNVAGPIAATAEVPFSIAAVSVGIGREQQKHKQREKGAGPIM